MSRTLLGQIAGGTTGGHDWFRYNDNNYFDFRAVAHYTVLANRVIVELVSRKRIVLRGADKEKFLQKI